MFSKFGLLGAAGLTAFGLVACGSGTPTAATTPSTTVSAQATGKPAVATAVPTPKPTAKPSAAHALACAATTLANRNDWAGAENHFLSAETSVSSDDFNATVGYEQLVTDTGKVAMDALQDTSTVADIATYRGDLSTYSDLVPGC
jgi:hypothetical protein